MENDSVYARINIYSIMNIVRERNPDMDEVDIRELAYKTIAELNKNVLEIIAEFERGEGVFDASYFAAKSNFP